MIKVTLQEIKTAQIKTEKKSCLAIYCALNIALGFDLITLFPNISSKHTQFQKMLRSVGTNIVALLA